MKEQRNKRRAAQAAVQAAQDKATRLNVKADVLRDSRGDLRTAAAASAAEKDLVLDRFVTGEATPSDVDVARDTSDRAQKALLDAEDLLNATERVAAEISRDLPKLTSNVAVATRELWQSVYESERDAILKAAGNRLWRAYVARTKVGGVSWGPGFIAEVFGAFYVDRIKALSVEMDKEFLAD